MGCCSVRKVIGVIQVLQIISTVERQVFDFLGFMWAPILGNFIHLCFVVVGLFGVVQYRSKYVITYGVWCLVWLGLNLFVISLYLEIGAVTYTNDWLSFKTNHLSWFKENGFGCTTRHEGTKGNSTNGLNYSSTSSGCLLDFEYIETIHAGVQCMLSILVFPLAFFLAKNLHEEDDRFDFIGGFNSHSAYEPPSKSSRLQMQPLTA
ncbi:sodium/potassium-transporting ATPase subunit beta-1-interacting protein 1-like [Xenia sp. Carnegie-2017]|uniref:sodium/potassium-transporting ATPase subunit beta-1-interacting protein 1-like n=1 Tax=Xenia sp. Carnegie-2017 TaxID=2897299 RepID=UPI001F04C698|nr:sodium/potassium-transporting ATPase subunit beta-1-interacting protein 1-like [Xenia sp. Carnegie-2017]